MVFMQTPRVFSSGLPSRLHLKTAVCLLLFLPLLITGCSLGLKSESQSPSAKDPLPSDLELADAVRQTVERHQAVDQAVAVALKQDISVAIKVTGFDRLRLKQIKQEVNDLIRQVVPREYTIHITTDKRIFRDLNQVSRDIAANDGIALPKTQDQLAKLNKDMHK
jgi:hypothetical protein